MDPAAPAVELAPVPEPGPMSMKPVRTLRPFSVTVPPWPSENGLVPPLPLARIEASTKTSPLVEETFVWPPCAALPASAGESLLACTTI